MFGTLEGTVDQAREQRRAARRRELEAMRADEARKEQRKAQIVREAEDDGDWRDAGCASSVQWFMQLYACDYRSALRIVRASEALRSLPALEHALGAGELTLDQAIAVAEVATPESDAELARVALGKAPSEIARTVRIIVPPLVADDQALYQQRALRMTWTRGGRELRFSGSLPLEQGAAFEQAIWNIAKPHRAADKKSGSPVLEWQQYTADALVTLAHRDSVEGRVKRSPATLIVHLSDDDTPPLLEGSGPISPETAERHTCDARRLTIKPSGSDLVHSRVTRCASYAQQRALHKRSGHCQYPGCTAAREHEAHHLTPVARGGKTEVDNLILLCPRHHKLLHDHHIRTSGTGEQPVFTDRDGRAITTNQPHAPPR
jgi:hypothetical protein